MHTAADYFSSIDRVYCFEKRIGTDIRKIMHSITEKIPVNSLTVKDKVGISGHILGILTKDDRCELATELLEEQVTQQRFKLNYWSTITAQSSQIDTGYIAQHLVSLQTQIAGQGMRGKGNDLSDGSEVKSANFMGSMDKKGAVAPRWNFTAVTKNIMEKFLSYPAIYLVSMDSNPSDSFRVRIWKLDIQKHEVLRNRYVEWMEKLGYPKFSRGSEESVNFQLFPPRNKTDDNFARHGNGRGNGFCKLKIELEGSNTGSNLIFRADEVDGKMVISKF